MITTGLEDQTVNPGATVNFFVQVTGTEPLHYQWKFEDEIIAVATTNVLTLINVVTNDAGSASSSAELTVRQAPIITGDPEDLTVNLTSNATFTVVATGDSPLSYQWFFDNAIIPGAISSSFSRPAVSSSEAGDYFVVVTNLGGAVTSAVATLTISYEANPFLKAAGIYNGLFFETNEVRHESAGYFKMTVRTNAAFSGKLLVDGNAVSFSGKFASDGTTNKNVLRTKFGKGSLALDLQIDFGADQVLGTVSSSNWIARLISDRIVFNTTNVATNFSGKYTMLIPGSEDVALSPAGYSYGSVNVRTNGKISFNGLLADRQISRQATVISREGLWPLFVPLYKGVSVFDNGTQLITNKDTKGSLIGWLALTNAPTEALTGRVNWTKKGWTNNLYTAGFTNDTLILGSYFTPVTKGTRLLSMTNGTASFFSGNLPTDVTHTFTLRTNNTFLTTSVTNLKVSVSASSGILKGSFRHPESGSMVPFYGAVLQEQNFGGGFFLGTNESGLMLLEGE